ncbi:MAG: GMP synthase [Gammaproteobacteria bacterium]|nr:GMP synthase [Gammaproteobacteria bacterium]
MEIAILQTDSVSPALRLKYGDYPDMFENLLVKRSTTPINFTIIDCHRMSYPRELSSDAYIITGSRSSVYEDKPWIFALARFVEKVVRSDRKLIGICFGHQLIAHFFGGKTEKVGWVLGTQKIDILESFENRKNLDQEFFLLSTHRDQVTCLPDGARLVARSENCGNSGYAIGRQILTLQSHPEFSKDYFRALIEARRKDLDPDIFEIGSESLTIDTDQPKAADWILNFLEH